MPASVSALFSGVNTDTSELIDQWVSESAQMLGDQSEVFYGTIIRSVDPDARVTFKFAQ